MAWHGIAACHPWLGWDWSSVAQWKWRCGSTVSASCYSSEGNDGKVGGEEGRPKAPRAAVASEELGSCMTGGA